MGVDIKRGSRESRFREGGGGVLPPFDFLQQEPFVLVSDYMNHDKYAALVFLEQISEKFKNQKFKNSRITTTKKYKLQK